MLLSPVERAPIDFLLARLLLEELDAPLVDGLRRREVMTVLKTAEPGIDTYLEGWEIDDRATASREEFARLFLLPGGVTPRASAWESGQGCASDLVNHAMLDLGRRVTTESRVGNVPIDHLGFVLDLAASAATSADSEDRKTGDRLYTHALGDWVVRFADALQSKAQTPVYRCVGRLVRLLNTRD